MQRIKLSDKQLSELVTLRKNGNKWVQIEKQTNIPRRIAKREYELWEHDQSLPEIKDARKIVVAEVFREHVNQLMKVTDALIRHIREPSVNDIAFNADQFLDELWKTDILSPPEDAMPQYISSQPRNLRRNHLLLKCLQQHSRGQRQWSILRDWESEWNSCTVLIVNLQATIAEMMDNFWTMEEEKTSKLKNKLIQTTDENAPLEKMTDAILTQILGRLKDKDYQGAIPVTRILPQDNCTHLTYADTYTIILKFRDSSLATLSNRICNNIINNLSVTDDTNVISLRDHFVEIKKTKEKLEEALDPLVLQPQVLRTQCNICPA